MALTSVKVIMQTYLWRLCTPPSTWAEVVLRSNFNSPEYIIDLEIIHKASVKSHCIHENICIFSINCIRVDSSYLHMRQLIPEVRKTASPNILTAMLDSCDKVWHKLMDGTLVNNGSRDALGHFDFITLTVK